MSKIFCTECGKAFDGEFALSYHRKLVHSIDDSHVDYTNELITADMEKANRRVKGAVIAGIISGVITLIFTFIGANGFSLWNLIDAALIFGLTFGVYKKNRTCAIALLAYWIFDKLYQLSTMDTNIVWWGVVGVFTGYYIQGIMGTFSYQKQVKEIKHTRIRGVETNSTLEKPNYSPDAEELRINRNVHEYGQNNQ